MRLACDCTVYGQHACKAVARNYRHGGNDGGKVASENFKTCAVVRLSLIHISEPTRRTPLGASAQNIGRLLNTKNIYFVPLKQDDCIKKPNSLVADFDKLEDCVTLALQGKQHQPIFL